MLGSDPHIWPWDVAEYLTDHQSSWLGEMSREPEHDARGEDCYQVTNIYRQSIESITLFNCVCELLDVFTMS